MSAALTKLTEAVGRGPATSSHENPKAHHASGSLMRVLIAAAVLVCVVAAAALGAHYWSLNHRAEQSAAEARDKSIAVLPFTDMSEKKDQEYFADGMAEEILDLLAKIPGLTVVLVHLGILGGRSVASGQKTDRPRSTNALFQAVSRH
jgi:hypothetical protein